MKITKNQKYLISFIIILLAILIIAGKVKLPFSTIIESGDAYYDEKCVDVSQYYSQGYVNYSKDANGCQLVSLSKDYAILPMTKYCSSHNTGYTKGIGDYAFGYPDDLKAICKGMGAGTTSWVDCTTNQIIPRTQNSCGYCSPYCQLSVPSDIRGGLERVINYCNVNPGDILVAESFAGARTITKSDLRYPITAFCRAHPAIITDISIGQSLTSTNVPQDLIDGKSVSISSSQSITIFYYINNIYNLPNICSTSNNEALNVDTGNTCKSTLGFTYLCSEGVWDAKTGACVVVKTDIQCSGTNERLVINTDGSKVCIYNPPVQVSCPEGYTYDDNKDACYRVPQSENICVAPYELFEPTQTECTATWEVCPQCPPDKICSQAICQPQCSEGIECRRYITPEEVCLGTLDGAYCTYNGTKYRVCASGETWDNNIKACTIEPEVFITCPNGAAPIDNTCYIIPEGFVKCLSGQIYTDTGCKDMTELYDIEKTKQNYMVYVVLIGFGTILILGLYFKFRKR